MGATRFEEKPRGVEVQKEAIGDIIVDPKWVVVMVEYQSDYVVVEVFKGMVVYGGGLRLSVCFWVGVGKLDGTIIGG